MLFLLCLALAADPIPPVAPTGNEAAGETPAQLLESAVKMRQDGNLGAATRLLVELEPIVPSDLWEEYLYQRALCEELGAHPDEAKRLYLRVMELKGPRGADAQLRMAMILEDQGDSQGALDQIRQLAGLNGWSEADALTIQLLQGMTEISAGKKKKGIKNVQAALTALDGTDLDLWLRARARYTLARLLYEEAMDFHLTGSDRKAAKNLKKRAARMKAAENQVLAMIPLNQIEWILASLLVMGDAYRDWAVELRGAPPPKGLSSGEMMTWETQINHYADNAETKAWHAYDEGLQLALRLAWESPRVAELKARRDDIPGR